MSNTPDFTTQMEVLRQRYQAILDAEDEPAEIELPDIQKIIEQLTKLRDGYNQIKPPPVKHPTIPVIFGKQYDENFLSSYLAYVLDPNKNGIGIAPLACLLKEIFHHETNLDASNVRVYREYPIDNNRLDVMIEMDDESLLVIENKLYSPESDKQTLKYYTSITHAYQHADIFFLYLTINGAKPSSEKFHPLSYKDLLRVFRKVRYDWRSNVRSSILWEDFLIHVEEYIVMDKGEFKISDYTRLLFENYSMINLLQKQLKEEWPDIIQYIEEKFKTRLSELPEKYSTNFNDDLRHTWQQIYKDGWSTNDLPIHFEFHLGPGSFEDGQVWFSVDVEEGNKKVVKHFRQLFNEQSPLYMSQFEANGIRYHGISSKDHPYWLASKVYPFNTDLSNIDAVFFKAIQEFSFLVQPIDELIKKVTIK